MTWSEPLLTKAGKHGVLYRYRVRYRGAEDLDGNGGSPEWSWYCWAYNSEHARLKFEESDAGEGWVMVGVECVRERAKG